MDRDEAIKLLMGGKEGIAEWNRLRESGEPIPNLRGASLCGATLSETNLGKANLIEASLSEADIRMADLSGADLRGADLRGAVLSGADLSGADLRGADLRGAVLEDANLSGAVLSEANLSGGYLRWASLRGADLSGAVLSRADLSDANLNGAVLSKANLSDANLSVASLGKANLSEASLSEAYVADADLSGADLRAANLSAAYLSGVNLSGANLSGGYLGGAQLDTAICSQTAFGNIDLSEVKGLDSVRHRGPSTVGVDTLLRSKGKIPEPFLRGCGLSPWEVHVSRMYSPALSPPGLADLQCHIFDAWTKGRSLLNGCFISYSSKNADFVDDLRDRLMVEGINVWLDRRDMVAGTIQDQVWRAIQVHHVVIFVLSKESVSSDWVEHELEMARKKEKAEKRAVLCPITLDDAWREKVGSDDGPGDPSQYLWRTVKEKHVVDFSGRTEPFDAAFRRLVTGLNTNYRPGSTAPDTPP
jgi:uncharacterized protein YjbI with pentapeptide repeats